MTSNPEDYQEYIKDKCCSCNESISATWKNYKVLGNFCKKCSAKTTLIVSANSKKATMTKYKRGERYDKARKNYCQILASLRKNWGITAKDLRASQRFNQQFRSWVL